MLNKLGKIDIFNILKFLAGKLVASAQTNDKIFADLFDLK